MNKLIVLVSIFISISLYAFTGWLTWYRWKNDQDILIPIILYLCLRNWIRLYDVDAKIEHLLKRQPQLIGAYKRRAHRE